MEGKQMSGQTKCGLQGSNGIGALIALAGIVVFAVNVIMWGWHFFVDGLQLLGFFFLAWLAVKARIWWLVFKGRLTGQVPYVQQLKEQTRLYQQQPPPVFQPQQQAIPAAQVHYHYGDQLSLPSVTDDGLERIINRRNGQ